MCSVVLYDVYCVARRVDAYSCGKVSLLQPLRSGPHLTAPIADLVKGRLFLRPTRPPCRG